MSTQEAIIDLKSVTRMFGPKRAVAGLSMQVPRGAVHGLIGPNGAGKTTAFSMIAGYISATSGEVRVLGGSPRDVNIVKGRLGVLPQDAMLPPLEPVGVFLRDMAELQGIPRTQSEASAREALGRVDGSTWWTQRCGALSHGMAKRVGLAQALLGTPELVLLDEPTAGLDPKVAFSLRQLIKSLRGTTTVLVSSHNLNELEEVCTGATIITSGSVVAEGSMAQLTSSSSEVQIELAEGPVPIERVRTLECVTRAEWSESRRLLSVAYDPQVHATETVNGAVLRVLLDEGARISSVLKGRSLEQRVMELT